MKTGTFFPALDLAQVDAAIFNLDGVFLASDRAQVQSSQEYRQRTLSSAMALARELRACQIKTAIVTASAPTSVFANLPGLSEVFDKQVVGASQGLLKAADLLKVSPERTAIFETTQAGVRAGRAGRFGFIVGFDLLTSPQLLKTNGADVVVGDLGKLPIRMRNGLLKRNTLALTSGLEHCQDFFRNIHDKTVVVFLDYDGTLTPIVDRPELATLSEHTRATLRELANHCIVGVISGRDRANVQQMVNVDSLIYAGSHGFDIGGPKNWDMKNEMGTQFLPILDQIEAALHQQLDSIVGTLIERKKFSVAVHYGLVGSQDLDAVRSVVESVVSQHPDIRTIEGKMLYDLQPRIDWDKGKALVWLLKTLNISHDQAIIFFFGDDITDEDAFRVLQKESIGIVVEDGSRYTYATYRLDSPDEVHDFLQSLMNFLRSPLP